MNVHRINVSTAVMPKARLARVEPSRTFAKAGTPVMLKPHSPSEFNHLVGLVGIFNDQVGSYAHVHFDGQGTVAIHFSFLVKQ